MKYSSQTHSSLHCLKIMIICRIDCVSESDLGGGRERESEWEKEARHFSREVYSQTEPGIIMPHQLYNIENNRGMPMFFPLAYLPIESIVGE